MDDSAATNSDPQTQTQSKPSSTRRRRHSIATSVVVPTRLSFTAAATTTRPLQSSNTFPNYQNGTVPRPPPLDDDVLLSLKCSPPHQTYTSLKDILPVTAAVSSPTPAASAAVSSGYEISIRNRLVKQAAWAYLQPMSSSPGSSGPHLFHRLWLSFLSFFNRHVVPAFTHLLHQASRGGGAAGL
ncbi:hypothetical protein ACB094_09G060700 [Castanea mollissima]